MAYSVQADLEQAAGGAAALISLCDHAAAGSLDAAALVIMNAAIAKVDAWIDSHARHRYTVPFATVPDSIKYLSAEETVYRLALARDALSRRDEVRHEENLAWLSDLTEGRVSVGEDPLPAKSAHVVPVTVSNREGIGDDQISRSRLKGLW